MRFASSFSSLFGAALLLAGCSGSALDGGKTNDAGAAASDAGTSGETGSVATTGGATTCKADPECNDIATQSSLSGACDNGRCKCVSGASLVPGGKCRPGPGLGAACKTTDDCAAGLECLDFAVHPKEGGCQIMGKQCTIACNASAQSSCSDVFGPGIMCFAGCSGNAGICGQTP